MNKPSIKLLKIVAITVFISLIAAQFLVENGTSLAWTTVVPLLPILFLIIGYANWRIVCPLAFFSTLSQNLNWIKKRKVPYWFEENFYYFQFFVLFVAFSARLTLLNFNDYFLGYFFIFTILASFMINLVYFGKSWCNFFCPVSLVEKIYCSSNSKKYDINSACSHCSGCKLNCPDIDMESNYWKESQTESLAEQKTFVFYSFSGLVLGFYVYFYLQTGSFDYYFSGSWTQPESAIVWEGFYFAPYIPSFIAAPITLGVFSFMSFYLFKFLERLFWTQTFFKDLGTKLFERKVFKEIDFPALQHRMKVLAAFVAFNIFYFFAGAPTYMHYPILYNIVYFLVIVISVIVYYREVYREYGYYLEDRVAIKFIKNWNKSHTKDMETIEKAPSFQGEVPKNIIEVFYKYAKYDNDQKSRITTYTNTVKDLLDEGILSLDTIDSLGTLREQMGISDDEHYKVIFSIQKNSEYLFDTDIEKSLERKRQKYTYQKMLEENLINHTEISPKVLNLLQQQFNISEQEHKNIVEEFFIKNKKLEEDVVGIIKTMNLFAQTHNKLFNDKKPETNFFKYALRNEFNILSHELFAITDILYEDHQVQLTELKKVFKYRDGILKVNCEMEALTFMDDIISKSLLELKAYQYTRNIIHENKNLNIFKDFINADSLLLNNAALLALKNYNKNDYNDVNFDKFFQSHDKNVIDIINKVLNRDKKHILYESIMYLQKVPFFSNIQFSELKALAKLAKKVSFKQGTIIIEEGKIGDSLYILLNGIVTVNIKENKNLQLLPGSYFGEIAVLADVERTATVMANEDVDTLELSAIDFKCFIDDHPSISTKLIKDIVKRLLDNNL